MNTLQLANAIARAARLKKAQDVVILDMRKVSGFCDYFVIMSATSNRHANTLASVIQDELGKEGVFSHTKPAPNDESGWVVLDYSGVLAHMFYEPVREFYALESLWADAKRVRGRKKAA